MLSLLSLFIPKICLLCGDASRAIHNLCENCEAFLPWLTKSCISCALPLPQESGDLQFCASCLKKQPPFQKTIALFHYRFPIDQFISRLKSQHQLAYAKLLGQLLAQKIKTSYADTSLPEIIIPVPLHVKRLQERGFNQALEIAKPISKYLHIKINRTSCIKYIATLPQASLSAKHRKNNIKNVFRINHSLNISHVAIIDDVVTTGQTVTELAGILNKSGIHKIDIWCCARTLSPANFTV